MYIREDLLNKIKEIFNIKEFTYVGTGKHGFSNNDLLIFNCDDENKTHLKIDKNITSFSGKAFDFTFELVLLAMENS